MAGGWWEQVEPGELLGFSCHLAAALGYATPLSPRVWLGSRGARLGSISLNAGSPVLFCCPHLMPCPLRDPGL